jgi:hypothetical protein
MSTPLKHITELHKEITEWKSMIELVRDETKIFQKELAEVSAKNTGGDIRPLVAHFESQFIRQAEVSDELYHELKITDHQLAGIIHDNPAASHVLLPDHEKLRNDIAIFEKLFGELKAAYRVFLAKWM